MKPKNLISVAAKASLISSMILIVGCGNKMVKPEVDVVGLKISGLATEISSDIRQMTRMTQKQQPSIKVYQKASGPLATLVTMKWSGDIEKVVESVAKLTGFKYRTIGQAPLQKTFVNINVIDKPAFEVLEDIGMQAGEYAGVVVNNQRKEIHVNYLENR